MDITEVTIHANFLEYPENLLEELGEFLESKYDLQLIAISSVPFVPEEDRCDFDCSICRDE